ncbi:MAG: ion channel [Polyangia bacterium]
MKSRKDVGLPMTVGTTTVFKIGAARFDLSDPYHMAITMSYWVFVAWIGVGFIGLNAIFATLYAVAPGCIQNARPGSMYDAFFFSVETMATVGYGSMAPANTYGHLIASFESIVGIAFTAVATGIIFVRFSRPRSRMMFADRAVVTSHDGVPTLMIRMAYARMTTLMNVSAELDVMLLHHSTEGTRYRLAKSLKLVRRRIPALILAWTVMHTIDESSPLHGMTEEELRASETRFFLTIGARDQQLGVEVHDIKSYVSTDVAYGVAYRDVVKYDDEGNPHADLRLLGEVVPQASATAPAPAT